MTPLLAREYAAAVAKSADAKVGAIDKATHAQIEPFLLPAMVSPKITTHDTTYTAYTTSAALFKSTSFAP